MVKEEFVKGCKEGVMRILALGYSQSQLSRMFEIDVATMSQWVRLGRIGEWKVGRITKIPELQHLKIEQVRPDLTADRVKATVEAAKKWSPPKRNRFEPIYPAVDWRRKSVSVRGVMVPAD